MTQIELWERFAKFHRSFPEIGMSLDISRMRFSSDFFEGIKPKLEKALEDMKALENGGISNPDEGRMVGHYWLRNPKLAPTPTLCQEIETSVRVIEEFASAVHSGKIKPEKQSKFENVIIVGIGGSALGPQLIADALGTSRDKMKMFFCDNTDPDGICRITEQLGDSLGRTLVISISKSGGTVETRNGAIELAAAYRKHNLSFAKHAVAVTCEASKLDKQAEAEGWIRRIYMWDWVGGRTSLFSAVGLLPAALQGIDIQSFLEGAKVMDALTRVNDIFQNPASLLAAMWHFSGDGRGKKDMVILPYKDRLCLFSKYLQQLVMESLGKEKDLQGNVVHQGIAVYGNKGSTDQHAYVQQLRDGLNNFFVTFIQVYSDYSFSSPNSPVQVEPNVSSGDYLNGFLLGTRQALYENGRDSILLSFRELTPKTLGALIALYDRTVGFYASLVGINAYHQPGVEAGKKAAARVIELQCSILAALRAKKGTSMSLEEISKSLQAESEIETLYHILIHLAHNASSGVSSNNATKLKELSFSLRA